MSVAEAAEFFDSGARAHTRRTDRRSKDGKVVCFFQSVAEFKARCPTLGLPDRPDRLRPWSSTPGCDCYPSRVRGRTISFRPRLG